MPHPKCVACGGSGRSSRGRVCSPCDGQGIPKGSRSVDELIASGETLTGDDARRVRAAIDAMTSLPIPPGYSLYPTSPTPPFRHDLDI